jgi:hypothetical protein
MLFLTVYTFRRVLLSFLEYAEYIVCDARDTFWGNIANLSFMKEVLASVALELAILKRFILSRVFSSIVNVTTWTG